MMAAPANHTEVLAASLLLASLGISLQTDQDTVLVQ